MSRPQALPEIWDGRSMKDFHEGRDPETRECEGCGQQKPVEEMSTVFLPGTGETYQCINCRGGP